MEDFEKKAYDFIRNQQEFHLGFLVTEQPHHKTANFSETIQSDTAIGIDQLLSVDEDIPAAAQRVFSSHEYVELKVAVLRCLEKGKRICFSGCGSSGRLAILLETLWRRFWLKAFADFPRLQDIYRKRSDAACSIMTGGDRALIKSVENFEDFQQFGRRQVQDLGIGPGDLFIAITEGGETSSVIGTVHQALENGAKVIFLFNNPAEILAEHIQRSREIVECPEITVIDLTTGSMALTGSTRMQATTMEMLVAGAALEESCTEILNKETGKAASPESRYRTPKSAEYADLFSRLVQMLRSGDALKALSRFVELEETVYRNSGQITYFADTYLLDIFSDTTERTPTFMLPPFRKAGETSAPPSWAFARNPLLRSKKTWECMLQRKPCGIDWGPEDYRQMQAPRELIDDPPVLDQDEIHSYRIGSEDDPSRYSGTDSALILVHVEDTRSQETRDILREVFLRESRKYRRKAILIIGEGGPETPETIHISLDLPETPMYLFFHLAVKVIFNAISTATMGRMGRIMKNWMIQVETSNKKLIDRSIRIISEITGLSYEKACVELFLTMEESAAVGDAATSNVVTTIERIQKGMKIKTVTES